MAARQAAAPAAERVGKIITSRQARLALAVALVWDLIQAPAQVATLSGVLALPIEAVDIGLDVIAGLFFVRLLGFHWALAPTFLLEALPFVDVAPTWTACVWLVIEARKHEGRFVKA